MDKVRIDRWLWSVRIFKTRTLATNACKTGRVKIDDKNLKPSYLLRQGELITVKKDGFVLSFLVKELINKRVSASLAAPCYENMTPEDELNKYKDWFVGKASPERREKGAGRPTKRQRRELEGFKDDYLYFEDF